MAPFEARALCDYAPDGDAAKLGFSINDMLLILDRSGDTYWLARLKGKEGFVPAAFVARIDHPNK